MLRSPVYHHLATKHNTKSPVWVHFGLPVDENGRTTDENIVICKNCLVAVSSKGGNTSNMFNHLKNRHPLLFRDLKQGNNSTTNQSSDIILLIPGTSSNQMVIPEKIDSVNVNGEETNESTINDKQTLDSNSERSCTDALTKFLGTTMMSYNIVEDPSFIEMIRTLNPWYHIPGRKFFSQKSVPTLYNKTIEKIRRELSGVNERELSITTDCWEAVDSTSYIAIIAHFVTDDWNLKSVCLSCTNFYENLTAEDIQVIMENTLLDWGINIRKIASLTCDDTNPLILEATRELGVPQLTCFCNNINIAVHRAMNLPELNEVIENVKKLQNIIDTSWKMKRDLRKFQAELELHIENLPSACPSKWWSIVKLCKAFLKNQCAISKILLDYPSEEKLMPDESSISALRDFLSATTLLQDLTGTLAEEQYISVTSVLPLYTKIKKSMEINESDSVLVKRMKSEISKSLEEKYEHSPFYTLLQVSSLCDPRFRLNFIDEDDKERVKESTVSYMLDIYIQKKKNEPPQSNVNDTDEPPSKKAKTGLAKFLDCEDQPRAYDEELFPLYSQGKELENYLSMPKLNCDQNPLYWWQSQKESFPILSVLARKLLAMQGSSVPSERIFSSGENIITKQRSSILPKNAAMQVFLAYNKDFI